MKVIAYYSSKVCVGIHVMVANIMQSNAFNHAAFVCAAAAPKHDNDQWATQSRKRISLDRNLISAEMHVARGSASGCAARLILRIAVDSAASSNSAFSRSAAPLSGSV